MRRVQSGFTLIELMIVIAIIGLLAVVLLPNIMGAQDSAHVLGDQRQLERHFQWLFSYKQKSNQSLPTQGGHKFVLTPWTAKIFAHNPENFSFYFTPGPARDQDPHYQELYKMVLANEEPWPNIQSVTPEDTHYVGRARRHLRTAEMSENEAWMANDNDGIWCLRDGTINILFANGKARPYSYLQLQQTYGLGEFDELNPVRTWGEESPIEPCRKLDN